ncbi:MAG: hypothetical protein MK212_18040 [Saprospiraceae bacterium]|nr:hypothetical protein [Saprospiraceae bacterium]
MNTIKKIICSVLLLGLAFNSFGQQGTENDIIYLKNGSILCGKVLEYKADGNIKVEVAEGSIFEHPASDVVKIKKQSKHSIKLKKHLRQDKPLLVPENKKMYNIFMGKLTVGANTFNNTTGGGGLYYAAGYRFNHFVSLGLGIGFERNDAFNFMPVFIDFRGYLMKTSTSMYYSLGAGYNVALPTGSWRLNNIEKQSGGLYLHPAIGVRFKSRERTHFMMDLGYTIQSNHIKVTDWWLGDPVEQTYFMFRPTFRIGLMF